VGDVGVGQPRKELSFSPEPAPEIRCVHVPVEDLQRHILSVGTVDPLGSIDRSHASTADGPDSPVGSDRESRPGRRVDLEQCRICDGRAELIEE
jgi:hypothetical protein